MDKLEKDFEGLLKRTRNAELIEAYVKLKTHLTKVMGDSNIALEVMVKRNKDKGVVMLAFQEALKNTLVSKGTVTIESTDIPGFFRVMVSTPHKTNMVILPLSDHLNIATMARYINELNTNKENIIIPHVPKGNREEDL